MRGTKRPSNRGTTVASAPTTKAPRSARAADGAAPRLCPRCRGSFVLTCVRDERVSVECPLCGRLWAEPTAQVTRSPRRASGASPPATNVVAGAAA